MTSQERIKILFRNSIHAMLAIGYEPQDLVMIISNMAKDFGECSVCRRKQYGSYHTHAAE